MTQIVGVDVGGTFTDLVLFDTETEALKSPKFLVLQKIKHLV